MTALERRGLVGEVLVGDCYKLQWVEGPIDTVLDIGANVGIFSAMARIYWPDAYIYALEPNEENLDAYSELVELGSRCSLQKGAIGAAGQKLFRARHAVNGAHECYKTPGPGYGTSHFTEVSWEESDVPCVSLEDVYEDVSSRALMGRTFLKLDVEGAESHVFDHSPSVHVLALCDYFAIELHRHMGDAGQGPAVDRVTEAAKGWLAVTHEIQVLDGPVLWGRKR